MGAVVFVVFLAHIGAASGAGGSGAALGVYKAAAAPDKVNGFGTWLGRQPTYAMEFLAYSDWSQIASPIWWLKRWQGSPYIVVFSVAMVPDDGGSTLAAGAAGDYDDQWRELAENLVAYGQSDAVLRIGWEFNGDWFPWSAYLDPDAFVRYWRNIVSVMRSVPGANFRFEWSPVMGTSAIDPELVYPGNAWVDLIGLSAFDQSWFPGWQDPEQRWNHILSYPYGLQWHRDYAASRGKPLAFPEWSVIERSDGHGGGDNPAFISHMYDWFAANKHAIVYHSYFDPDPRSLTFNYYPKSAVRFRALFAKDFPAVTPVTAPQPVQTPQGADAVQRNGGPTVRIKRPKNKARIRKRHVKVRAVASAPKGLRRVMFRVDGRKVCIDRRPPFTCKVRKLKRKRWHQIVVTVTDKAGWTASADRRIRVLGRRTSRSATLRTPAGAAVSRTPLRLAPPLAAR